MRLWNKSFGKEAKATDFAGRTIAKGAYNDRNSEFGWNVDHIQPQSKGGVTADHNLVCCHILTNDEKADKFPCFKANGHSFEIVKVQNHYEIRSRNSTPTAEKTEDTGVDFYDSAAGLRFFKKLKGVQNQNRWIGTVEVKLEGVSNTAVAEFIEELFNTENISLPLNCDSLGYRPSYSIKIQNFNMPLKKDIEALLDKCVLLNTYLSRYFMACHYVRGYRISYGVDCVSKASLFSPPSSFFSAYRIDSRCTLDNTLFVNKSVLENTRAGNANCRIDYDGYAEYNYIFTNLADNLTKEANRG